METCVGCLPCWWIFCSLSFSLWLPLSIKCHIIFIGVNGSRVYGERGMAKVQRNAGRIFVADFIFSNSSSKSELMNDMQAHGDPKRKRKRVDKIVYYLVVRPATRLCKSVFLHLIVVRAEKLISKSRAEPITAYIYACGMRERTTIRSFREVICSMGSKTKRLAKPKMGPDEHWCCKWKTERNISIGQTLINLPHNTKHNDNINQQPREQRPTNGALCGAVMWSNRQRKKLLWENRSNLFHRLQRKEKKKQISIQLPNISNIIRWLNANTFGYTLHTRTHTHTDTSARSHEFLWRKKSTLLSPTAVDKQPHHNENRV